MEGWCTLVWGCHSIPSFACSLKLAYKDDLKGDPVLRISTNDKSYCMPGPGLPLWCNPEHHENKQTKQQRTNCGLNNFLSQGHTNRGHGEGTQPRRTYPALPQADWLKPRIHVPCMWPERGLALQRRGHLQSELAAKGGCSRWQMTELSVGRPWRPRVQATCVLQGCPGQGPASLGDPDPPVKICIPPFSFFSSCKQDKLWGFLLPLSRGQGRVLSEADSSPTSREHLYVDHESFICHFRDWPHNEGVVIHSTENPFIPQWKWWMKVVPTVFLWKLTMSTL